MAKISKFDVPYPDFKLGEMIDPEQFDANNIQLVDKTNEVIESMNNDKLDKDGNFVGTWNGLTPGEIDESINGGRVTVLEGRADVLETDLAKLTTDYNTGNTEMVGDVKGIRYALQQAQQEIANLNLYTDASNRVINGYTFGAVHANSFGMDIDWTKTDATSNLIPTQTIIPVISTDGFKAGQEVTVYDDVNLERVKIKSVSGTNIVLEVALTKDFKMGANVARTMFDKDKLRKAFSFGQWQQTKKDKYALLGSYPLETSTATQGSQVINSLAHGSKVVSFTTAFKPSLLDTFSFDMDVLIPDLVDAHPLLADVDLGARCFGLLGIRNAPIPGFGFGYTLGGSKQENAYKGMVSVDRASYLKRSEYTFYFYGGNSTAGTTLIAQEHLLKEYIGKPINIKIKLTKSLFASAPTSAIEFYINGKRIPLALGENHAGVVQVPLASAMILPDQLTLHCAYNETGVVYTYPSYAYISRFIMYKDLIYTTKVVEYLFDSEFFGTFPSLASTDTSGNNFHLSIGYIGSSPYISGSIMRKIAIPGKPIETNDIRFVPKKDSKEIGVWSIRSDKLIAQEGTYSEKAMVLSTIGGEDQFIGERDASGPSDIRLTYKKTTDSIMPVINKIVGGVI